jgi:hypothetical protein
MPLSPEAFAETKELADALVVAAPHLAAPIDFSALIASGILAKAGGWYEVLDRDRRSRSAAPADVRRADREV